MLVRDGECFSKLHKSHAPPLHGPHLLGILYFILMFRKFQNPIILRCGALNLLLVVGAGSIVAALVTPAEKQALTVLLTPLLNTTQSIAMSHMMLNVREAASCSGTPEGPSEIPSISAFDAGMVSSDVAPSEV